MPDIYATNDGHLNKNIPETAGGSWDAVRDATGSSVESGETYTDRNFVRIRIFTYSGSTRWILHRGFMEFDTSGISTAPLSATLKIYCPSSGRTSSDNIVVKGTQSDSLTSGDFDNLDFNTPYSAELSTWTAGAYNDFTLNSDALTAMANDATFKIAIINYDYDYLDVDPGPPSVTIEAGANFSEGDSDKRPYISYVSAAPPEARQFTKIQSKNASINIKKGNLTITK
tara:strand:- start:700 stop:1383 length:684 start_codon:yes stop_codon:yes gene_type:complete